MSTSASRRPLVLTGGPAVGKTTTAHAVADLLPRCAVIDVDDIRQLICSGHAAPWDGDEGLAQQRLGVENACGLGCRLHASGFEVIIADVLTPATTALYRRLLPGCLVLRLHVTRDEAAARALSRKVYLTDDEFWALHTADVERTVAADRHLDVTRLGPEQQRSAVLSAWTEGLLD